MSFANGEHTFEDGVLISGRELRGYTAASALTAGEPVGISGDFEVDSSAADGGDFIGVALYDVAAGEEVAVAGDDCEVRVVAAEAISPGDEVIPDGTGKFETVATSTATGGVAIAENSAGGEGEVLEAYIFAVQGNTSA
jgi:hypothetical protein